MELPARLCGLWALLLSVAGGGDAAPTGECGPRAPGGSGRAEGDGDGAGEVGEGGEGTGGQGPGPECALGSVLWTSGDQRLWPRAPLRGGGPRAVGLSGSRATTAELENEHLPLHFPCAVGKKHASGVRGRRNRPGM